MPRQVMTWVSRAAGMRDVLSAVALPSAAYLVAINLATYIAFFRDKASARAKVRRIPERTLLGLAAAGGSPAAFLAQQTLRHKTRKQPFGAWLIVIAGVQACALAGLVFALSP